MYKLLLSLGYYVLAVDYRGYGDSTNITPSEETTVSRLTINTINTHKYTS